MSEINDQNSDSSSEINWPLDHPIRRHHDVVIFENVADQYVKDADVTAFFTIVQDIKVNPDEDQIGLSRVGCTNIKECLAYASVQFNPSMTLGSTRCGTASFPSSELPVTDDEFYQFCYILNKTKTLGASIPFQLNCAPDEIDLLSNTPIRKTQGNGLIAVADKDNDEFLVVHTKSMLTEERLRQENRRLLEINHVLETEKDEFKTKFSLLEAKSKDLSAKMIGEMESLTATYKTALAELTARQQSEAKLTNDYNECQALYVKYKTESEDSTERYHSLEASHTQIARELNQLRSQLAITVQLTKDQATQVIDLERRLMQASELAKDSEQRQATLEQQINEFRLSSSNSQAQMESYVQQIIEKDNQISALEKTNESLQVEVQSLTEQHQSLSSGFKETSDLTEQLQKQLEQMCEQHRLEKEASQKNVELLTSQLNKLDSIQEAYVVLQSSYKEIEKRCVKHQKNEIEAKKKLTAYAEHTDELQREIQELRERVASGANEYRTLYRKCASLEYKAEPNPPENKPNPEPLTNSSINDDLLDSILRDASAPQSEGNEAQLLSMRPFLDNAEEIQVCPVCYMEFLPRMTFEEKTQHAESHFQ